MSRELSAADRAVLQEEGVRLTATSRKRPSVDRDTPEMSRKRPSVDRDAPEMSRKRPGVDRDAPEMSRKRPGVDRDAPEMSRKRPSVDCEGLATSCTSQGSEKWSEVKNYLDPNPQLKGWDAGRLQPKVRVAAVWMCAVILRYICSVSWRRN